ncbi:MAG: HD domain-containing phosphohydrolase [Acidaminobacteraceae bacterium]
MFKNYSILVIVIVLISSSIVLTGVQVITENNFEAYVNSYEGKIEHQVSTYMNSLIRDLEQAIESNAYWTDAIENLENMDSEWFSENSTSYIIEMDLFNTDYILITDETLKFTQESGGQLKDILLVDEYVLDSLNNNTVNKFYKSIEDDLYLIVSSPFLDNELQNPTGLYVSVKKLDVQFLDELQFDFGEDLKNIQIGYDSGPKLITSTKKELYTTFELPNSDRRLELLFDISEIYDMLFIQRDHIFASISIVATIAVLFVIVSIFVIVKRIKILLLGVENISNGDYDYKIKSDNGKYLFELNKLTRGVNKMSNDIKEHLKVIDENYNEMVDVIINAVEINDAYTSRHNIDVGKYSKIIATEIGYDKIDDLILASKLHDIGKISIPGHILNKSIKLTVDEFEIIKIHPLKGYQIIEHLDYFEEIKLGVKYHHEKYDGSGYPDGLKGDEIPMMAQIISIADVYDALTSDRSYRKGLTHQNAIEIIKEGSGSQFNPSLIKSFLNRADEFRVLMIENRAQEYR